MALTQTEIYSLAKSVGLTDSRAKIAAAVAMAESKGDPNAHNPNPPDDSYGLWQINMLGSMGPERRKQLGLSSNQDLYNPATNAKAMKALSQDGGNFNPWSTYTNQAYQQYMSNPVTDQSKSLTFWQKLGLLAAPIPGVGGLVNLGGAAADAVNPMTAVADALGKTAKWVSNSENWIRVGYVVGGSVVVIAGLVMLVESTKAGRTLTKAAAGLTPPGRVASVASAAKKGSS